MGDEKTKESLDLGEDENSSEAVQNSQLVRKIGEEIERLYSHKEMGAIYDLKPSLTGGVFSLQYKRAKFEMREVGCGENDIIIEFVIIPDDEKKSEMYKILNQDMPSNRRMSGKDYVSVQTTEVDEGEFVVMWKLKTKEINHSYFASFVKGHVLRHFFKAAYLVSR